MNANPLIAPLIQAFFQDFLVAQRGLSPNTIAAYRDGIKLFLNFAAARLKKPVDKLMVEDFQDQLVVVAFLDDLERSRGNSTRTRNARLAALHALFRYIAGQQPEALARCQQICAVPAKRTTHKPELRTSRSNTSKTMGSARFEQRRSKLPKRLATLCAPALVVQHGRPSTGGRGP